MAVNEIETKAEAPFARTDSGTARTFRSLGGGLILVADFLFMGYLFPPLVQAFGFSAAMTASIVLSVIRVLVAVGGLLLAGRKPALALIASAIVVGAVAMNYLHSWIAPDLTTVRTGIVVPSLWAVLPPVLYVTAWLVARGRAGRAFVSLAAVAVLSFACSILSLLPDGGLSMARTGGFPMYVPWLNAAVVVIGCWLGFFLHTAWSAQAPPSQIDRTPVVAPSPTVVRSRASTWSSAAPAAYGSAPASHTNGLAIASLIVVFFSSVIGMVLGYVALSQIKRTGESGRGLALAAVIIGWVATALALIAVVVYFVALSNVASHGY